MTFDFLDEDDFCDVPLGYGAGGQLRFAIGCARNLHRALAGRMAEGHALASWLRQRAASFGIADDALPDEATFDRAKRQGFQREEWQRIGTALDRAAARLADADPGPAARWVAALAEALELDPLDAAVLRLALHYALDRTTVTLWDGLSRARGGPPQLRRDAGLFALLLDASPPEVDRRLAEEGRLRATGLLYQGRHGTLEVLERLASLARRDVSPGADLHDQLLGARTEAALPWDLFAHLGREAEVAADVLRAALAGRERGVNVLLYGPPGTGKTSFAATLAERVGARLRPVAETDEDGEEPNRRERLAGLRLAQRLALPGRTLLLFDEAEDLFTDRRRPSGDGPAASKVFAHRLLEGVALPVIWTANDIQELGPTVLRRMTMCLELKVPNVATRAKLWRRIGEAEGVALDDADAAGLARLVPAAPAVASAAMRAARLAGGGADTARLVVEGVARAVRGRALPPPETERDALYDPLLVNADADLAELEARLTRPDAPRAVSFLLSGPPGSGKSAWVRHLAERMGLPLVQKRASDLLSMWLGGTEGNIADAFAEAREAGAFLVFDEADSLLGDRGDAVRSWEVTQVNEMLTWMESHALPFACTTNLPDRLDRASLRRFLVKLRFDWLAPAQARLAFRRFFDQEAPPGLDGLHTLVPADFALVRRRAAVTGAADAAGLLRMLMAESEGRVGGRLSVGFGRAD